LIQVATKPTLIPVSVVSFFFVTILFRDPGFRKFFSARSLLRPILPSWNRRRNGDCTSLHFSFSVDCDTFLIRGIFSDFFCTRLTISCQRTIQFSFSPLVKGNLFERFLAFLEISPPLSFAEVVAFSVLLLINFFLGLLALGSVPHLFPLCPRTFKTKPFPFASFRLSTRPHFPLLTGTIMWGSL